MRITDTGADALFAGKCDWLRMNVLTFANRRAQRHRACGRCKAGREAIGRVLRTADRNGKRVWVSPDWGKTGDVQWNRAEWCCCWKESGRELLLISRRRSGVVGGCCGGSYFEHIGEDAVG